MRFNLRLPACHRASPACFCLTLMAFIHIMDGGQVQAADPPAAAPSAPAPAKVALPDVVGNWSGTVSIAGGGSASIWFTVDSQSPNGRITLSSTGQAVGTLGKGGSIHIHIFHAGNQMDDLYGYVHGNTIRGNWTTAAGAVTRHGQFTVTRDLLH